MLILNTLSDDQLPGLIQAGGVGVLPTDTVYGLVCRADLPEAVARLYALKLRDHKPGTVVAATTEQLLMLGLKKRYVQAVAHLWPASLSIEIPHDLEYLHQGTGRSAFRVVADPELRHLLEATGPLLTSSANQPGEPVANTVQEAIKYFGDSVDYYVDGGDLSERKSSTLIRVVDDTIDVIREGAVKFDAYGRVVSDNSKH
jgi:L-threonylcarbamoyladenylate synthase